MLSRKLECVAEDMDEVSVKFRLPIEKGNVKQTHRLSCRPRRILCNAPRISTLSINDVERVRYGGVVRRKHISLHELAQRLSRWKDVWGSRRSGKACQMSLAAWNRSPKRSMQPCAVTTGEPRVLMASVVTILQWSSGKWVFRNHQASVFCISVNIPKRLPLLSMVCNRLGTYREGSKMVQSPAY